MESNLGKEQRHDQGQNHQVLKVEKAEVKVKLIDQTSPKFAHNAKAANKDMFWTYEFWLVTDPGNRGQVKLEMDVNKLFKMNENQQSKVMNDAAIALVQDNFKGHPVKLTSA
jgi:hypothetical protein